MAHATVKQAEITERQDASTPPPKRAAIEAALAAETIEWARNTFQLSTSELAKTLGVSERTIKRWIQREAPPSPESRIELRRLNQVRYLIDSVFRSPGAALNWALAPNDALRGLSPLDAMTEGRLENVRSLLAGLEAGAHL